jgi:hypothetical protein
MKYETKYQVTKLPVLSSVKNPRLSITVKAELAIALRALFICMGTFTKKEFIDAGKDYLKFVGSGHKDENSMEVTIGNCFSRLKRDGNLAVV